MRAEFPRAGDACGLSRMARTSRQSRYHGTSVPVRCHDTSVSGVFRQPMVRTRAGPSVIHAHTDIHELDNPRRFMIG